MFRRRPHGGTSSLPTPVEEYCGLRRQILSLDPTTVGLASVNSPRRMLWGAMVDLVCADVSATVVALRDGTTSVYTDIGFSIIGAGTDERVSQLNEDLLVMVGDRVDLLTGDPALSLPAVGSTVVTTLTVAGPRSHEVETVSLARGDHPLAALLPVTYEVLHALEAVHEQRLAAAPA